MEGPWRVCASRQLGGDGANGCEVMRGGVRPAMKHAITVIRTQYAQSEGGAAQNERGLNSVKPGRVRKDFALQGGQSHARASIAHARLSPT